MVAGTAVSRVSVPGSKTAQAITRIHAGKILDRDELAAAFLPVLEAEFNGADVAWGALTRIRE